MLDSPDISVILSIIIVSLCIYAMRINGYFKKRQIDFVRPVPFFGNMFSVAVGKKHILELMDQIYGGYSKHRYVGIFNFSSPITVVKDVNLIKKICVKDFDHFVDHMNITDERVDPYLGRNIFSLNGEKWKEMRNTLSPAFTTSKMRKMLPFIQDIGRKLVDYVDTQLNEDELKEFDVKILTSCFSNDVIASCAFGIQVDSFKDRENNFYSLARNFTQLEPILMAKMFLYFLFPTLFRFLGLKLMNQKSTKFFHQLFISNMKSREENNIIRPDMVHLLMLARKGSLKDDNVNEKSEPKKTDWTEIDMVAQALIFIFAGFETISTALSFMLYELALNQNVQKRLRNEIDIFMKECNEEINYDNMKELKYLDMVVSEILRLWPPGIILDRVCVKPYTLPPQNDDSGISLTMDVGDVLWMSAYNIHRDPEYYKNPYKFDPERFSDKNRSSIDPNAYFPFGTGPRACIGSRFALMEMKIFATYFVHNFEIHPTENTTIPMELQSSFFDLAPKKGHNIGIKKRTRN